MVLSFLRNHGQICTEFEGVGRGVSKDFGSAWQRVRPFLGLKFSGFVDRGPLDRMVALDRKSVV